MEEAITAIEEAIRAMHETVTAAALDQARFAPEGRSALIATGRGHQVSSLLQDEQPALLVAKIKFRHGGGFGRLR
jgi:hypothetical protein